MPARREVSGKGPAILYWLALAAGAYGLVLHFRYGPTGTGLIDGTLGVILGLYVCSHPAANFINLLFYASRQVHAGASWLALNLCVALAGWVLIVMGLIRFFN